MIIEVQPAKESLTGLEWIQNVFPLYIHDLSEYDHHIYHLNERGSWEPDFLSDWFNDSNAQPMLIRSDGAYAGFAFVGCKPFRFVSKDVDFRMAEFFILRSFRRLGIGRQAAKIIFRQHPGKWEVLALPNNHSAVLFWRAIVSDFTDGNFEQNTHQGMPRQIFTSPA